MHVGGVIVHEMMMKTGVMMTMVIMMLPVAFMMMTFVMVIRTTFFHFFGFQCYTTDTAVEDAVVCMMA